MMCSEHGPYADDDGCGECEAQALAEAAVHVFAMRGRWLVVYDALETGHAGIAIRRRSKQEARREVAAARRVGVDARLRRYRRNLVARDYEMPGLRWRTA